MQYFLIAYVYLIHGAIKKYRHNCASKQFSYYFLYRGYLINLNKNEILSVAKQVFIDEIAGLHHVLSNLDNNFIDSINAMLNCLGKVVVTGIGKSGHIAKKIAATLASTGTPAFFMHPAEALHGDLGMINDNDVVLALSYSGEVEELSSILSILKRRHIVIIGMTGSKTSSLAKISNYTLDINVVKEACPLNLAPTSSTTAALVLGDALAICLLTIKGFKEKDFAMSHPGGSLGRKLLTTNQDIMHIGNAIPKVKTNSKIKDIVIEISEKGLGFTSVIDEQEKVIGIITDGDLRRVMDKEIDFKNIIATNIMTKSPKVINAKELAVKTVELMEQFKITGFLCVDNDSKLVGAFNLHDLFRAKLL